MLNYIVPHTAGEELFEVGCGVCNSEVRVRTISIMSWLYVMVRSCACELPFRNSGSATESGSILYL